MKESSFKRSRLELYYYILKSCIINEKHTRSSLNRQIFNTLFAFRRVLNLFKMVLLMYLISVESRKSDSFLNI